MIRVPLIPSSYSLLDKLLNSGQLSWRTNQRIRNYPVTFKNERFLLPGYLTQHELVGTAGNNVYRFRTSELKATYSGHEQSAHDAISHGTSLTTGSSHLAELLNACFHYFHSGAFIGLDNP